MKNIELYSHEQQDEFIINLFNGKEDGCFLDVACGHPVIGSNTYTLEKFFNWQGFGVDIGDFNQLGWGQVRKSKFVQIDATSNLFNQFLSTNIKGVIDYISLDVDNNGKNLAFETLTRVIDAGIKFKALTFEHEYYIHKETVRDKSRKLLENLGYVRLFEDVTLWPNDFKNYWFEDWWIDPSYFDYSILEVFSSGEYYFECIDKIKSKSTLPYIASHKCCQAFPDEYSIFWHEHDQYQKTDLLNSIKSSNYRRK